MSVNVSSGKLVVNFGSLVVDEEFGGNLKDTTTSVSVISKEESGMQNKNAI